MAIEWILAVNAALAAFAKVAATDVYKSSKDKVGNLFSDGPLSRPLRKSFQEAFSGFHESLAAAFPIDQDAEKGLKTLAESAEFAAAVGQLPLVPFRDIDTARLREMFQTLGPPGSDDGDFSAAWKALGRRFNLAAAESVELKNLIDLAYQARQEIREEAKAEQFEAIRASVERLVQLAEASGRPRDDEPLVRKYRATLFATYRFADTRGLFMREKEGVGEGIELREVFVETPLARLEEKDTKKGPEATEGVQELSYRVPEKDEADPSEGPLRLGEVVARERLTVILGGPGSGKSTLVRCLCLTLCRPEGVEPMLEHALSSETIPVLLDLKEFASALQKASHLELDKFLLERNEAELPNLEALLEEGRAIVLLDGLDEVFDESHRRWVSDEAWRLMSRFQASRFILTSRPHGYRAAPLPGPVCRWRLEPFADEQIGQFFTGWFEALAREGAEAGAGESPKTRAESLTKEVLERPRLKEMAQNPLLCTLIVLVHRSRSGKLPQRRVVFYEAAVRTLAEVWERMKHYPVQQEDAKYEFPEPEILIRAMAEIAWKAFHQLGSREIPGPLLRKWFQAYMEREPDWQGKRGERAVKDLLRLVGDRTGLLTDLGGDRYQFVHLSLHEWLVSFFLLDRLSEAQRLEVMRYYLHSPEWEESLRLLVAGAPQAQADILAQNILENESSDLEDVLRRDLRFICRCLGDLAPLGPRVRAQVEVQIGMALSDERVEDLPGLLDEVEPLAGSPKIFSAVEGLFNSPDEFRRSLAEEFLLSENLADSAPRGLPLARMGDKDSRVRSWAVSFFARHGASDPATRDLILARLGDEDAVVRSWAVFFFVQHGASDPATRDLLLARLGDEDPLVRSSAVSFFEQQGASDPATRDLLLARLGDEDPLVRSSAVFFFVQHGASDPATRDLLLVRLGDEDPDVRSWAVSFFAQQGASDPATRDLLLAWLGDENPGVRRSAVSFFLEHGASDPATRDLLLARLGDENPSVRRSAVLFFVRHGASDPTTRDLLLARLGDEDPLVRRSAVEFFRDGGPTAGELKKVQTTMAAEESPQVLASLLGLYLQAGLSRDSAVHAFEIYEEISMFTSDQVDLRFSIEIGRLAATEPELRKRLMEKGKALRNFHFASALHAMVEEDERLSRLSKPLQLSVPGCEIETTAN